MLKAIFIKASCIICKKRAYLVQFTSHLLRTSIFNNSSCPFPCSPIMAAARSCRRVNQSKYSEVDRRSGLVERKGDLRSASGRKTIFRDYVRFVCHLEIRLEAEGGPSAARGQRMNTECRQFFRICVGFPRRPSFIQTLTESSYDKAISGDLRGDSPWHVFYKRIE